MRFTGTWEDLQLKLSTLKQNGEWVQLNTNQVQFKHKLGGIINWYPNTGKVLIQGAQSAAIELKQEVERLLELNESKQENTDGQPIIEEPDEDSIAESVNSVSEVLEQNFSDSELIIGLVGAVGTDLERVTRILRDRLVAFNYETQEIKISKDIISPLCDVPDTQDNYIRTDTLMTEGNHLREKTKDNSVLALATAAKINEFRVSEAIGDGEPAPLKRKAFIVNSLKHPEEVQKLRDIYADGFFLIGVYSDEKRRYDYLTKNKRISAENTQKLMLRDADESDPFGQHTRNTFHLSDFFINFNGNSDKFQNDVWRTLDLVFGKPYVTPTFDEFAMFMAFSASLRSADLSRQVGAVMTKNKNIVSTGANDVPEAGGGLYWPDYNDEHNSIVDKEDGRDYKRGFDSNALEKRAIIDDIISKIPVEHRDLIKEHIKSSRIKDITEYGRVVHAEMEAILACARSDISTKDAELFCTTFPCHNCAKHIVASGIKRVVYVEPYPKSKAFEFHSDSISLDPTSATNVIFEPFVGVGPRSFFNLFSTNLGSGYPIKRKNSEGSVIPWGEETSKLRMQMLPSSYIERETLSASIINDYMEKITNDQ